MPMRKINTDSLIVYDRAAIARWTAAYNALPRLSNYFHRHPLLVLHIRQKEEEFRGQINLANRFLLNLANCPISLVIQLYFKINRLILDFEHKYPANQSSIIRECLMTLLTASDWIMLQARTTNNFVIHRRLYLELCGLLTVTFNKLQCDDENQHYILAQEIMGILQHTYIKFNGDLPDDFATRRTCTEHFNDNNPYIQVINLYDIECLNFANAKRDLQRMLGSSLLHRISNQAVILSRSIIEDIEIQATKGNFDKKLATSILLATHNLLVDPTNESIQKNYISLANHVAGKPSIYKKMAGVFLAVVGVGIIAASIVLGITSIGLLGTLVSIYAVSAIYDGYRLFKLGERKGLSKSMQELATTPIKNTQPVNFVAFSGTGHRLG
jgi:hypothetical protein